MAVTKTTTQVTVVTRITTEGEEGEEEEEGAIWDTIDPLHQGEGTINPLDQDTWHHLPLHNLSKFVLDIENMNIGYV